MMAAMKDGSKGHVVHNKQHPRLVDLLLAGSQRAGAITGTRLWLRAVVFPFTAGSQRSRFLVVG